jgi:hypothetical protein
LQHVTDGVEEGQAMGNWAAFGIGVSSLLLLEMFVLKF